MNTSLELDRVDRRTAVATAVVPVFALALFTSAALLFWVQPLIAKMLLPLLGGGPSVWNTCLVFFQALLLAGYAYALLLSQRLSLRNQAIVHALLLLAAAVVLPFAISERSLEWLPTQSSPVIWLLTTLLLTVGPPFLLISATAPPAAAMVFAYESQISTRSLFPLRDQQCRQHAGAPCVSVSARTQIFSANPERDLDSWICGAGRVHHCVWVPSQSN